MNILRIPFIKTLLKNRLPQFVIGVIALAGFLLAILTGFLGTPVGSRNFSIVFVWIAWWAILMLVAVPLLGRGWWSICPNPLPGEWLQRGAMLGTRGQTKGLGRRWSNRFRNIWLQNGSFLLVALFSTVILTQPRITAIVLAAFLFIALGASPIYERRDRYRRLRITYRKNLLYRQCGWLWLPLGCFPARHGQKHLLWHLHGMSAHLPARQYCYQHP